jgi:putative flippase GtrA
MLARVWDFLDRSEERRFLAIGVLNTGVGYLVGVMAFLALSPYLHIVLIGFLASVISICFSFLTQRRWVFKSTGPWLPQLRRSFAVYGAVSAVGTALLWPLVEIAHLSIWLAQAVVLVACTGLSYAGQKWFTFGTRDKVA